MRQTPFNTEFQDLITRYAWGEIWTRPHFDQRTRRVLVIGTMLALDKWDEFRLHVRAALVEGGFTPDDIKEIILQQAIYCGVPAANHAFKEAAAIVAGARAAEGIDRPTVVFRLRAAPDARPASTMAVPSSSSSSVACSRSAAVSPTCEAITMLAKLIRLPTPSAMPSASSQPPLLRIAGRDSRQERSQRMPTP